MRLTVESYDGTLATLVDRQGRTFHVNAMIPLPWQPPAIWVGTFIKNFPMALLWNLFAAGPVNRLVFSKCFSRVGEK